MVDCHIHMVLDGVDWRKAIARHSFRPDLPYICGILAQYRELGVTWLRDGGDRWGVGRAARAMAAEFGITYRTPLFPISRRGHYGGFIGRQYETMVQFRALLGELRQEGGDFVKLMISGLMDFDHPGVLTEPGLDRRELAELIAISHGEGFSVMAHANGADTVEAAALAGVDSVEHGAYLNEAALDALGAMGVVWVPTLSTVGNLLDRDRFDRNAVKAILENTARTVADFAAMGGLLAPGSDAGAWAVPHAVGCQTEYKLLKQILGEQAPAILEKGIQAIQQRF